VIEHELCTLLNGHPLVTFVITVHRQKFSSGDKVTSFGKEYLCNTCLSRVPTVAVAAELQTSSAASDDDSGVDKKYKTRYNSVSAPVTPAKQNLSATAQTVMTDADSSLDMSTRSLLEVQTIDGMYDATVVA